MVNRIWQGHFGEGLVRSPNNWGRTGEQPTHPELLDWLASRFVENDWSVKAMHRLILGSNAYRMSVSGQGGAAEADPENRLLSRFNRQRLSVEAMRDSMLAVAGDIDLTMGGNLMEGKSGSRPNIDPDDTDRRTLYIPVRRGSILTLLSTFDFGDATTPGSGRATTNVAPQALYARNSEFVRSKAVRLSELVLAASTAESDRLADVYLRVLGRRPTAAEADAAMTYMARMRERLDSADAASAAAFSNPRMILKWVGTGEDTGWVVISFLAGSGRGISRGREAQPGRSRIASCATSFLSVRFALRAESGRREPGGRTQARLGGASRPRRGRVSPARAARGQQFPLALLHP